MATSSTEDKLEAYNSIKNQLYKRLVESGWSDQVRMLVRMELKESNCDFDNLIDKVLPKVRSVVPAAIKREMLQKLKSQILQENLYYDMSDVPT